MIFNQIPSKCCQQFTQQEMALNHDFAAWLVRLDATTKIKVKTYVNCIAYVCVRAFEPVPQSFLVITTCFRFHLSRNRIKQRLCLEECVSEIPLWLTTAAANVKPQTMIQWTFCFLLRVAFFSSSLPLRWHGWTRDEIVCGFACIA